MPPGAVTDVRPYVCDTGQGRTFLFVAIETSEGAVGVGEGSQSDQDAAVLSHLTQIASSLVGRRPTDVIETMTTVMSNARAGRAAWVAWSAVEQALWDVIGCTTGLPVTALFGGAAQQQLPCYATIAAGVEDFTPDGLAAEAERCVASGCAGVKVVPFLEARGDRSAVGRREILARGRDRLTAVREAIGPAALLLVECAFALDLPTLRALDELLTTLDCFWVEAPLRWDDPAALAEARNRLPTRLASGETAHGRLAFRPLIEARCVDVLQPDVKWTGGLLETKKVAAWAEAYQLEVALHNNSGPVATAASAQLSLTLPNAVLLEHPSRVPPWQDDVCSGALARGHIVSADMVAPGIGVTFDEAAARTVASRT
jgi:galactonate dehydratase